MYTNSKVHVFYYIIPYSVCTMCYTYPRITGDLFKVKVSPIPRVVRYTKNREQRPPRRSVYILHIDVYGFVL